MELSELEAVSVEQAFHVSVGEVQLPADNEDGSAANGAEACAERRTESQRALCGLE